MWRNTQDSYGSVAKFFHWVIFLLVLTMIIFGYFLDDIPKNYKGIAYNVHKLTGLTVLALMLMRLTWALFNIKPRLPFITPAWEVLAERFMHTLLYIAVIGMPIAGWVGSVAAGHPPNLLGMDLSLPISKDKVLAEVSFDWHGTLAIVIIVLVSLHVLAALYHHIIKKDNILRRMLPSCSRH